MRARQAEEALARALRPIYRDPDRASAALLALLARQAEHEVAQAVRAAPECLGPLAGATGSSRTAAVERFDHVLQAAVDAVRARHAIEATRSYAGGLSRMADRVAEDREGAQQAAGRAASTEADLRRELGRDPSRGELESRIRRGAERLLPHEVDRLRVLATAPQLALVMKLRSAARDAAFGRNASREQ